MKILLKRWAIILLIIGLYSCSSGNKSGDSASNSATDQSVSKTTKDQIKVSGAALGSFHWGITDDAFGKVAQEWTECLTVDGKILFGGCRLKSNGIIPTYDKDGHLVKIVISFVDFDIHPESDYAEEEKAELEKRCVAQNKRLIGLTDQLSEVYGSPSENQLEEDNLALYNESGMKILVQWKSKDTELKLVSDNQLFPGKYGCKTQFRLEVSQIR